MQLSDFIEVGHVHINLNIDELKEEVYRKLNEVCDEYNHHLRLSGKLLILSIVSAIVFVLTLSISYMSVLTGTLSAFGLGLCVYKMGILSKMCDSLDYIKISDTTMYFEVGDMLVAKNHLMNIKDMEDECWLKNFLDTELSETIIETHDFLASIVDDMDAPNVVLFNKDNNRVTYISDESTSLYGLSECNIQIDDDFNADDLWLIVSLDDVYLTNKSRLSSKVFTTNKN